MPAIGDCSINGEPRCIAFGGLRVDDAIEAALLQVVEPGAIAAAVEAEAETGARRDQVREAMLRDLEAARYAADRPSGNTMRPIPRTASSRRNWRRAGTGRSCASPRSRLRSPHMMLRHRQPADAVALLRNAGR